MTRQLISTFRQAPLHYLTRSVRRTSGFVLADEPAVTEPAIPSSGLLITSKLLLWPPRTQLPDALLRAL